MLDSELDKKKVLSNFKETIDQNVINSPNNNIPVP